MLALRRHEVLRHLCDELKAVESEVERAIIEYAFAALDALEWKWGTCHLEIMWAEGKGAGRGQSGASPNL